MQYRRLHANNYQLARNSQIYTKNIYNIGQLTMFIGLWESVENVWYSIDRNGTN